MRNDTYKIGGMSALFLPMVQKLVMVSIIPLLIGMGLLTILTLFQYQRIVRDTVEQRYILFAGEIKTRSEQWLQSGLAAEDLPNVQQILNDIDRQVEEPFSIDVVDNDSVILYSLDPSRLGDILSEQVLRDFNFFVDNNYSSQGKLQGEVAYLLFNENDNRVIMAPLFDNFGNWAVAVIISFPRSAYLDVISDTTQEVIYYFTGISLAIVLCALIFGSYSLNKPIYWLRHLNARFLNLNVAVDKREIQKGENKEWGEMENVLTENLREMQAATNEIRVIDER